MGLEGRDSTGRVRGCPERDEGPYPAPHVPGTGRSLQQVVLDLRSYLLGWRSYFGIAESPWLFVELDRWIRRRLRAYQLKQWKRPRTIYRELQARGLSSWDAYRVARCAGRWWRSSRFFLNRALPNSFFDGLGLPRLSQ